MKKEFHHLWLCTALAALTSFASDTPAYQNDFEKAELNSVPEDFLVLDGTFEVKEEGGKKFLELPGAPLDSFGFLFGPSLKETGAVSAKFFGTSQGRRAPVFGVGLFGIGGYKLRVAPAKKALELLRGEEVQNSVPLKWESGKWTFLRLEAQQKGEETLVQGKVWQEGTDEPSDPTVTWTDTKKTPTGRSLIQASPYSGTPIRFDDIKVIKAK